VGLREGAVAIGYGIVPSDDVVIEFDVGLTVEDYFVVAAAAVEAAALVVVAEVPIVDCAFVAV